MFKKKYFLALIAFPFLVLSFQNCAEGKKSSAEEATNLSTEDNNFSQEVLDKANFTWLDINVIQPQCIECHNHNLSFKGFNFTSYAGVLKALTPGQPDESLLYTRSDSTQFFELTVTEQQIIRAWILNGAKND